MARRHALRERGRYATLLSHANDVLWAQFAKNPDLEQKIVATLDRIRMRQEGMPMTEFDDGEGPALGPGADSHQERMARRFLLKKAWRKIRSMVHPDRGRESREEFQILKDAYEAGDLDTLTEFVIAQEQTIMEQIAHWENAAKKPAIEWQIFQQMPIFKIVRAVHQGNIMLAEVLAGDLRRQRLFELQMEEMSMG